MTRIFSTLAALVLLSAPLVAHAQSQFATPAGGGNNAAQGVVTLCMNSSNQAIPCSLSAPSNAQLILGGVAVSSTNPLPVFTQDAIQSPSASFTRPANTTAYAAGYLVANSTTAGSVVVPSWATLVRAAGDCVRIERIRMTASSGSITNGSFRVYIFNSMPTVTSGDGAAFDTSGVLNTNTVDNMAGNFNVTFGYSGSDGAVGWGIPSNGSGVTACPTSGTAIYALVEATGAWTPPSASVITLYPELWKP
jgi:hypothetical protein